jgi:hypothetical protein
VFDPVQGTLRNKISPFGIAAIAARVYKGESFLDGEECIVLDYSRTSSSARWVRDEIREVGPGVYLGIAYLRKVKVVHFCLMFPETAERSGEGSATTARAGR